MYWVHDEQEQLKRLRKENQAKLDKADLEKLRKEGFTEQAIARFFQLRSRYGQDAKDQLPLDIRRLEFARWLVANGRLTDQIT